MYVLVSCTYGAELLRYINLKCLTGHKITTGYSNSKQMLGKRHYSVPSETNRLFHFRVCKNFPIVSKETGDKRGAQALSTGREASCVLGATPEGKTKPTDSGIQGTDVIRKACTSESESVVLGRCLFSWLPFVWCSTLIFLLENLWSNSELCNATGKTWFGI